MELMNQLRKASVRSVRVQTILLIILAVAVFLLFQCQNVFLTLAPKTLAELTPETLDGAYISDDIYFIYTQYVEEEQYRNNRPTGTITGGQFLIDLNETDYIAMFIHGGSNVDDAVQMMDDCYAYYTGEISTQPEMHISGMIRPMDSEEEYYYYQLIPDLIVDTDMTAEEAREIMPAYIIDVGRLGGGGIISATPTWAVWAAFAASIALLLWAIIPLIRAMSGAYQKPLQKKLDSMGEGSAMLARLDQFYNGTAPIGGVRLGNEFVFFQQGAKPVLLRPWEVAWAYQKTTEHRRNGVKTGTTYAVIFKTMDGKQFEISSSEQGVQQLLAAIHETLPGTVLGYTKEVEALYKKDRSEFRKRWEEAVPGCTSRT
ncbi:MAG: hypothetical protein HFF17_01795 [Oscillospiraceae bacterium]|nr:hypothetical protein [Oscillospiraceae bacterium]